MSASKRATILLGAGASLAMTFVVASCAEDQRISLAPHDAGDSLLDASDSATEPTRDADAASVDDADGGACSTGGYCWSELPPETNLRAVWNDGAGTVWAVSNEGNILSLDGSRWVVRRTGTKPLLSIWGSSPTDIWVGGGVTEPVLSFDEIGNIVLLGVDAVLLHGQAAPGAGPDSMVWTEITDLPGETIAIRSIWGSSADDVWAVGSWCGDFRIDPVNSFFMPPQSRILHYRRASGSSEPSWTLDPLSSEAIDVTKVWGDETGEPWLTAIDRYVEFSPQPAASSLFRHVPQHGDVGDGWHRVTIDVEDPEAGAVVDLSGGASHRGEVWLVGQRAQGTTYRSSVLHGRLDPAGTLFLEESHSGGPLLRDILMSTENRGWLLPSADTFIQQWDGTSWSAARLGTTNLPLGRRFWGIGGTSPDDVWIVGDELAVHTGPIPTEAK